MQRTDAPQFLLIGVAKKYPSAPQIKLNSRAQALDEPENEPLQKIADQPAFKKSPVIGLRIPLGLAEKPELLVP